MNLLLINPNTSAHVTRRLAQAATAIVAPQATVHGVTAVQGPRIVASRTENALAGAQALVLAAEHAADMDAVVLGVSTDTGLLALREMLEIPVTGMLEAGLLTAAQLGQRLGLLTLGAQMLPVYQEQACLYGLDGRVKAWAAPQVAVAFAPETTGVHPEVLAILHRHAEAMVTQYDLDVLILSGAVLCGYRQMLQALVPVPVVDSIEAATLQALSLAHLRPLAQRRGSFSAPRQRILDAMPAALSRALMGAGTEEANNAHATR